MSRSLRESQPGVFSSIAGTLQQPVQDLADAGLADKANGYFAHVGRGKDSGKPHCNSFAYGTTELVDLVHVSRHLRIV